jgi:hypothetical protein
MKIEDIYKLGEGFGRGAVRVRTSPEWQLPVRDFDIAVARGERRPETALRLEQYEGTKWFDFVGTQRAALRLVSERLLRAFEQAGLRGWEGLPIQLLDRSGKMVDGYRLLVIVGRCGPIDNARSVQVDKIVAGNKSVAKVWQGLYFDEKTWDGSDLFSPGDTALMFATSAVKQTLEREKATNISVGSLVDFERPSLV